jgi:hypothetical protein
MLNSSFPWTILMLLYQTLIHLCGVFENEEMTTFLNGNLVVLCRFIGATTAIFQAQQLDVLPTTSSEIDAPAEPPIHENQHSTGRHDLDWFTCCGFKSNHRCILEEWDGTRYVLLACTQKTWPSV